MFQETVIEMIGEDLYKEALILSGETYKMTKTGLFFISDYRDVTCKPGRDPSYWILSELDRDNRFEVHSTANEVMDSSCFKDIDFLTLGYKGDIQIQKPLYNYAIYKAYKKVKDEVELIHHCEKFQIGKGYNLIPLISDLSSCCNHLTHLFSEIAERKNNLVSSRF